MQLVLKAVETLQRCHGTRCRTPRLSVGQQQSQFLEIGIFNHLGLTQLSLSFGRFLGEYMALVRFGVHKFAGTGFFEPLGG